MVESCTNYTLTIQNKRGIERAANIAIYLDLPDIVGGHPLIWLNSAVLNECSMKFTWKNDWGLTWGTTPVEMADGVIFKESGPC